MQKPRLGPSGHELNGLVELFRLLSDKTRLHILLLLAGGERNVTSLCEELALTQPTASHHLGLLRMRNLISNRRDGRKVLYGLSGHVVLDKRNGLKIGAQSFNVMIAERD